MSIIDKIRTDRTGQHRPDRSKVLDADLTCGKTGAYRDSGFSVQDEYLIRLVVGTTFWANSAQFDTHYRSAEKALLQHLHEGILQELSAIRHGVLNDDRDLILEACARIQRELGL